MPNIFGATTPPCVPLSQVLRKGFDPAAVLFQVRRLAPGYCAEPRSGESRSHHPFQEALESVSDWEREDTIPVTHSPAQQKFDASQ
jgi:hypothetical protein